MYYIAHIALCLDHRSTFPCVLHIAHMLPFAGSTDLVQTCPGPDVCPSLSPAGCPAPPGSAGETPGTDGSGAAGPLGSQPPSSGSGQGGASAWPTHSAVEVQCKQIFQNFVLSQYEQYEQ